MVGVGVVVGVVQSVGQSMQREPAPRRKVSGGMTVVLEGLRSLG